MHFTLTSNEGLPIRGELDAPAAPKALVVIVHGFKGFKDWGFFPWLAGHLVQHGHAVCRFNMSRSGIGEDPETFERLDLFADDTYSAQIADLHAVVAFAQSHYPTLSTFLLGHSRGGGVALLAAQDVPQLEGVITWSAISRVDRWGDDIKRVWREDGHMDVLNTRTKQLMRLSTAMLDDIDAHRERFDIARAVTRLHVPLLIVHGARDEAVPVAEAGAIAANAKDASVSIIERASHSYNAIHPLVHVPFALSLATELSAHFVNAYC